VSRAKSSLLKAKQERETLPLGYRKELAYEKGNKVARG
jgi:hypothetical protein